MLQRRSFLCFSSSFVVGVLCGTASAAPRHIPLAARLMTALDRSERDDLPARGVLAMEILERIREQPRGLQIRADLQAVIGRASIWVGEALLALRTNLQAITRGADVDEAALHAAIAVVTADQPAPHHAAHQLRAELSASRRQRLAARLIARIDRAQAKAERTIARGAVPASMHESAAAEQARRSPVGVDDHPVGEVLAAIFFAILLAGLIVLLIVGVVVVVGVVTLVMGAASGNAWLLGAGIFCMLIGLVLTLTIFYSDAGAQRVQRSHAGEVAHASPDSDDR